MTALSDIEELLEDFSVPLRKVASYQLLAKTRYEAGFVTAEAVKRWHVEADVFVPKVARQFQEAGVSPPSVARSDLGTSDVVTLGHKADDHVLQARRTGTKILSLRRCRWGVIGLQQLVRGNY